MCPRGDCAKKPMASDYRVSASRWCRVMAADRVIRWTTAGAVVVVAVIAVGREPSLRAIRARLHVGQSRAQVVRALNPPTADFADW